MSSVRIERLFASISFRVAALLAALLVISFVVVAVIATATTGSAALADGQARIAAEARAIVHEAEAEGMGAAIAAVASRAQIAGALEYRIVDAGARTVTGQEILPAGAPGWRRINDIGTPAGKEDLLVYTAMLPDGGRLIIAENLEPAERVRDRIVHSLALTGGLTAFACLLAAWFATRNVLARFDRLSEAARQVADGDLMVRAQRMGPARDDIDAFTDVFNAMLDRVAALVANVRRVSTDVAHDLRTPLAHLGQKLERARQAGSLEEARAGVEAAQQSLDRVVATFAAILRLAEIEAGGLKQRFALVDLSALAERIADAYGPDIEAGGRVLKTHIAPKILVTGDNELIAQAAANLLENAMRHTPPGAKIVVSVVNAAGRGVFCVQDNGPGIPADSRARVLEPFVRLDESRSRPGAGLGLSIAAAVARLHDGALEMADAQPGLRVTLSAALGASGAE